MERPPGEGPGPSSLALCLWAHLIHHFPCEHCSMAPIAINGLAFKALSYLASSCVFFPWLLPMLFPPPRMHSQAPSPLFGILLIHQINVTSPEKPPQFLPGKKNLTSVLEQQRMTHVDLRWALVSYSMKYVRQGPSSLRIE